MAGEHSLPSELCKKTPWADARRIWWRSQAVITPFKNKVERGLGMECSGSEAWRNEHDIFQSGA